MNVSQIKEFFLSLTDQDQESILKDLNVIRLSSNYSNLYKLRGDALDDRRGSCPHCQSNSYIKQGKEKGSRRYKCKSCLKRFTEHTGTWINGIHKKHLIPEFMNTVELGLSLIEASKRIGVDPFTVFQWRHKFLSSFESVGDQKPFNGITESDETYFLHSQKGKKCEHRQARCRGGRPSRGITNDEASILTTMDREANISYQFTNMGRMTAKELEDSIGDKINEKTVLCSDGSSSFKAFASKTNIEHHVLNASKGQRVKGNYHIQHINSAHSRMKTFFNHNLKGVSTKYIQKYLNWQKIKDKFKDSIDWVRIVLSMSLLRTDAIKIFNNIENQYLKIYLTPQISS